MPNSVAHKPVLQWYAGNERPLPWRAPGVGGWAVLVSEVMLQQTGVSRVLPAYDAWMRRWPTPPALAADTAGEAVRMWGRLGYPRRALRLHAAAMVIETEHDGEVPSTYDALRALPGVGDYTAAAVSAFAYRQREVVLDTNVRRVIGRWLGGVEYPTAHVTMPERRLAASVLPDVDHVAATWSVALMELGALVCAAGAPACSRCPLRDQCRWRADGFPEFAGPPRRAQAYAGTDRQCRGRILAAVRDSHEPVSAMTVVEAWSDAAQRERALRSLLADGLLVDAGSGDLALP